MQEILINCHVSHSFPTYEPTVGSGPSREYRGRKRQKERGWDSFTLSLLIYFWDTLLHSTEFLHVAFPFALRICNKKAKSPKPGQKLSNSIPVRSGSIRLRSHPPPFTSVSVFNSFRLRDSNPCLPHASPTRYRLSHSVDPIKLQFPWYKWKCLTWRHYLPLLENICGFRFEQNVKAR